ncbi:hypothetical protein C8Q80DRAFT_1301651 [Daedaleopsis nitida]|nr:hypothetical protein C8Q80DRAFT_1301651 [Daedaleopsis nitida]
MFSPSQGRASKRYGLYGQSTAQPPSTDHARLAREPTSRATSTRVPRRTREERLPPLPQKTYGHTRNGFGSFSSGSSTLPSDQHYDLASVAAHVYPYPHVSIVVEREVVTVKTSRIVETSAYIAQALMDSLDDLARGVVPPVYEVPRGVTTLGFFEMLDASKNIMYVPAVFHVPHSIPLTSHGSGYLNSHHTEDELVALLITAHILSSTPVLNAADLLLDRLWGSPALPSHPRPLEHAFALGRLARAHDMHIRRPAWAMTHALYEVFSTSEFWERLRQARRPSQVDLASADVMAVYQARRPMAALWKQLVERAPRTRRLWGGSRCADQAGHRRAGAYGRAACAAGSEERTRMWREFVRTEGLAEQDDILRYNVVAQRRTQLEKEWCEDCLAEWEATWERKRVEWWYKFHALVQEGLARSNKW